MGDDTEGFILLETAVSLQEIRSELVLTNLTNTKSGLYTCKSPNLLRCSAHSSPSTFQVLPSTLPGWPRPQQTSLSSSYLSSTASAGSSGSSSSSPSSSSSSSLLVSFVRQCAGKSPIRQRFSHFVTLLLPRTRHVDQTKKEEPNTEVEFQYAEDFLR